MGAQNAKKIRPPKIQKKLGAQNTYYFWAPKIQKNLGEVKKKWAPKLRRKKKGCPTKKMKDIWALKTLKKN